MAQDIRELAALGLKPSTFTGDKNEDPTKFFKKLDRIAGYGNWSDAKKINAIPLLLDGKGYDFYEALSAEIKNDYKQTKLAIIEHFKPNRANLVKWNALNKMIMEKDQTVTDFHDELNREAVKIGDISDSQLLMIFLNGIHPSIRMQVASHEPPSLRVALEKARLYESISEMNENQKEKRGIAATSDEKMTGDLIEAITSLKDEIIKMKERQRLMETNLNNPQNGGQPNVSSPGPNFNKNLPNAYQKDKSDKAAARGGNLTEDLIEVVRGIKDEITRMKQRQRLIETNLTNTQLIEEVQYATQQPFNWQPSNPGWEGIDIRPRLRYQGEWNGFQNVDSDGKYVSPNPSHMSWHQNYIAPVISAGDRIKEKRICFHCGIPGHIRANCRIFKRQTRQNEFRKSGNGSRNVKSDGKYSISRGTSQRTNGRHRPRATRIGDDRICFKCGIRGHIRSYCSAFQQKIQLGESQQAPSYVSGTNASSYSKEEVSVPRSRPVYPTESETKGCSESLGRLVQGAVLKPNTPKIVKIYPESNLLSLEVAIDGLGSWQRKQGLQIEKNVQNGLAGSFTCCITNLTDRTIRLPASTPIARIFDTSSTADVGLDVPIGSN